jgi:hypothetical protein
MAERGDIDMPPAADWVVEFLATLMSFRGLDTNEIDNQVATRRAGVHCAGRHDTGNAGSVL